jgi:copper chaperone CopZ
MQRVDGVQSVKVSLKEGVTALDLAADNKVTLAQLRTVIKNNGFVSRDAEIIARGIVSGDNFEVSGTREQLRMAGKPTSSPDGSWRLVSRAK